METKKCSCITNNSRKICIEKQCVFEGCEQFLSICPDNKQDKTKKLHRKCGEHIEDKNDKSCGVLLHDKNKDYNCKTCHEQHTFESKRKPGFCHSCVINKLV